MRVIVTTPAELEGYSAYDFYEGKRPGLGEEFMKEVERGLALLAENPYLGGPIGHGERHFVLHRFPYTLVYRIYADHVGVLSIKHDRQEDRHSHWR